MRSSVSKLYDNGLFKPFIVETKLQAGVPKDSTKEDKIALH